MSPGLEIQIINVHLQVDNKIVQYLVINEKVEFELTKQEKAVATHMFANAGCVGLQGASHE